MIVFPYFVFWTFFQKGQIDELQIRNARYSDSCSKENLGVKNKNKRVLYVLGIPTWKSSLESWCSWNFSGQLSAESPVPRHEHRVVYFPGDSVTSQLIMQFNFVKMQWIHKKISMLRFLPVHGNPTSTQEFNYIYNFCHWELIKAEPANPKVVIRNKRGLGTTRGCEWTGDWL